MCHRNRDHVVGHATATVNTLQFPDPQDPDAVQRKVKAYHIHPDYDSATSVSHLIAYSSVGCTTVAY